MLKTVTKLVLLASLAALPLAGLAQGYPAKPVRMVVPFPPGTGVDILARLVGQKLGERWGQPVVIENRAGAGGSVGTGIAAKAPADGYTILMGNLGTHALNASLYKQLPYHPLNDFAPVTQVADVPLMFVVHPTLPVKNVRGVIALAKSRPGALNYGSAGVGSAGHLSGALFGSLAGINIVHVAYKGNQQALTDLIVGQVQLTFGNLLSFLPHARSGRVRGLAVTTAKRAPAAPDLPTMVESGVKGYEVAQWYGVFAPAKTPGEIVAKLNADVVAVLQSADVRTRVERDGAAVVGNTSAEFTAHVRKEMDRWAEVIRKAGVKGL